MKVIGGHRFGKTLEQFEQIMDLILTATDDLKLCETVRHSIWSYAYTQPELNSVTATNLAKEFLNRVARGDKTTIEEVIKDYNDHTIIRRALGR